MLAICESKQEVHWLHQNPNLLKKISHFFISTPDAAWAAEQLGISFINIEDYRPDTYKQTYTLQNIQIEWANRVDDFLCQSFPRFQKFNFRPTRSFFNPIQLSWHLILSRALILNKIQQDLHPKEVLYFLNKPSPLFNSQLRLQTSAYSQVIPHWASHFGVREHVISDLDSLSSRNIKNDYSLSPFQKFRVNLGMVNLKQNIYQFIERTINHSKGSNNYPIIALSPSYDVTKSVRIELFNKNIKWIHLDTLLGRISKLKKDLELNRFLNDKWDAFSDEFLLTTPDISWNLRPLILELLKTYWFETIPELWALFHYSIHKIEKTKTQSILAGIFYGTTQTALVMAAQHKKVKTIMYQHGAIFGEIDAPAYWLTQERYWSDVYLLYGNGEKEFLDSKKPYDEKYAAARVVGSARLDDIKHQNQNQKTNKTPNILYVPGAFLNNHFCFNNMKMRDVSMFHMRIQIFRLFEKYTDFKYIFRPFISIGTDPTLDAFKKIIPRVNIVRQIPLPILQFTSDLIIHEEVSTGMLEGLLTNKPMIVYANPNEQKFNPAALSLLSKRVEIAKTPEEMLRLIDKKLKDKSFDRLTDPNNDYLMQYGNFLNDGKSAVRAAQEIQNTILNS